mgnify:CR=1 FL=1
MSADWLAPLIAQLAAGQDVVLVTVARTQGSVPREAGASMLVGRERTALTIGGGHLEWQAIAHARRRLASLHLGTERTGTAAIPVRPHPAAGQQSQ